MFFTPHFSILRTVICLFRDLRTGEVPKNGCLAILPPDNFKLLSPLSIPPAAKISMKKWTFLFPKQCTLQPVSDWNLLDFIEQIGIKMETYKKTLKLNEM